ncbi:MAG: DUF1049 domain-containing protein [Betaproteobacteria bacterium]|nr:DUF1049 domain-containing protein [Betaproteobacteria bacterium]
MQLMLILAIVMVIGGVFFAFQNNVPVTVTFLLWRFDGSLATVLLLTLALGALLMALISTPATLKAQWTIARQRKQIAELKDLVASHQARIAELEGRLSVYKTLGASRGENPPATAGSP